MRIKVTDIIGSEYCVSSEDGDKVFIVLEKSLINKTQIFISFANVQVLTSAFLNNAIGRLLENFLEDDLYKYITIEDLTDLDKSLVNRVIKNAKRYYKNKTLFIKTCEE